VSDRIAQIRARLDAATPGPWSNSVSWDCVEADVTPMTNYLEPYRTTVARARLPVNADLIAHAPADIAWLIREVERWKYVAKNDLYGACWCDAPRHDCCICPGVNDDE
jgi:hypothetical protein